MIRIALVNSSLLVRHHCKWHTSKIPFTTMCVRAQISALEIAIRLNVSKEEEAGESFKVEITNTLSAEKDQPPPLSLVEVQAPEASFRQPTEAEISILSFSELRDARRHAQELSNEFARLLNRGSSLE